MTEHDGTWVQFWPSSLSRSPSKQHRPRAHGRTPILHGTRKKFDPVKKFKMFRVLLPKKILSLLLLFNSSGTNPKPSIFFALWHFQHCHWLFAHNKHGDGFDNDCISCDGIICHSLEIIHFSSTWYYNCCDWHRKYGEYTFGPVD